jgi:alkylation response protein AidB-like acyl-CoA dehydrogenase
VTAGSSRGSSAANSSGSGVSTARAARLTSGGTLSRDLPFERRWRDAQAGTVMPMGNLAARRLVGADTLGVATAPAAG